MRYFDIKKDSLEEVISKAINEKPEQLKEEVIAKDLLEAGGKYLKYSDLLLQKGRLMAKNQSTAMIDKEISKEMKKLGIKEATGDKEKYEKFFKAALKKFGADSPADLDGEKKKEFFNYIDKNYKGDHEESVDLEEVNAFYVTDKDVSNSGFKKLMKKYKLKFKETGEYNQGYAEVKISGDKKDMEKMMKVTGEDDLYKFNPRTKEFVDESKNLEAKTTKDVDETLDKIREANVEKGRTMRNILADIWNMGEGKNVFAKDEKVKKEEDEDKKSSKTATGQKPTTVEIEPEVK